jgi:hypothetical protein
MEIGEQSQKKDIKLDHCPATVEWGFYWLVWNMAFIFHVIHGMPSQPH